MLLLGAETLQACVSESSEYSTQSCKGDKTGTSKSDMLRWCKKLRNWVVLALYFSPAEIIKETKLAHHFFKVTELFTCEIEHTVCTMEDSITQMRSRCAHLDTGIHTKPLNLHHGWLWHVSVFLRASRVRNSFQHPTSLIKIIICFAFKKQNTFFRRVESDPKNRDTFTALWTSVLALPVLHSPFHSVSLKHFAPPPPRNVQSLFAKWLYLRLAVSFLHLHQEKSRGT